MMPDDVLRRLLAECSDHMAAHIIGCPPQDIYRNRTRLQVPPPWCSRPDHWRLVANQVAKARWQNWQEQLPPHLSREELEALIDAEAAAVKAERQKAKVERRPLTPGEVLVEIRHYHERHKYWPTISELAKAMGCNYDYISQRARMLVDGAYITVRDHQLIPQENPGATECRTVKLMPEEIEAHFARLGVTPGKPRPRFYVDYAAQHREEHVPPQETPPEPSSEPEPEVTETVKERHQVDWPSNAALVAEVDALVAAGKSVTEVLTKKYGVKDGRLWQRIGDAREREGLPRRIGVRMGQPKPAAKPVTPNFLCLTCQDSGYIGGGSSGEPCRCEIGERVRAQVIAGEEEPQPPVAEPLFRPAEASADPARVDALPAVIETPTERTELLAVDGEQLELKSLSLHSGPEIILLLVDGRGDVMHSGLYDGWVPGKGDHWAEPIFPNGQRRYRIWECVYVFTTASGATICVMMLPAAAVKEAA